jgi:uncharacterized protein DUF4190
MSDTQQGPGWWQASDGKWYPPETHPSVQSAAPGASSGSPGQIPSGYSVPASGYAVPPSGGPTYPPATPTGYPPGGYQPWAGGQPAYGYQYENPKQTNGLAVASLVTSIAGIIPFLFGIPCVVGIILGFVGLSQIKKTGGVQQGRGLAMAGVIVGFSLIAIFILLVVAVSVGHHNTQG